MLIAHDKFVNLHKNSDILFSTNFFYILVIIEHTYTNWRLHYF